MFKLKKYKYCIKPTIHLSNYFVCYILQRMKFKKKKKKLRIYTRHNFLLTNIQIFIKKRILDEYTKRGLFLKTHVFYKKKR